MAGIISPSFLILALMLLNRRFLFFIFLLATSQAAHGQDTELCDAVTVILRDAPNQFRNIRGNLTESNVNAYIYRSGINLPGAIKSRFVSAMGLFYESAVYQAGTAEGLSEKYESYKLKLDSCLLNQGYRRVLSPNFTPGMENYKKVAYMPPLDKNNNVIDISGHVTMEVDYNKNSGQYTLLILIFEH